MTEKHEVQGFKDSLSEVKAELEYEAATKPGEGAEVAKLFSLAAEKIGEAMTLLCAADALYDADDAPPSPNTPPRTPDRT